MAKFQNSSGCSVEIKPFTDLFKFNKLKLHEAIGGSIANGFAEFNFLGNEKHSNLISETNYIEIDISQANGGISYKIDALITSKKVMNDSFIVEFLCINNLSFIDKTLSLTFKDINEAIEYSYTGAKDIRCESDLANDCTIVQFRETSYDFCKRIAQSFFALDK